MSKNSWNPKRVLFIGTYAADIYFEKLITEKMYVQLAANQTEKYYITELSKLGIPITVLSCLVTNGAKKRKVFLKDDNEIEGNHCINNVGFLNIPYVSVLSQTNAMKKRAKKLIKEDDWDNTLIIVYSMRIPYLEAAKIIKQNSRESRIINIVPDLPAYMNVGREPFIRRILSGINEKRLLSLREYVDGHVLYSRHMSDYLELKNGKWIVIEGIYNSSEGNNAEKYLNNEGKIVFMYAGGVDEAYGVKNLVEGFIKADLKNAELHIYGSGRYTEEIKTLEVRNNSVKYCGVVTPNRMKSIMHSASALVNPRPSNSIFTKYSCPSKVIEYMGSGVPVIMTRLEGIPEDYFQYAFTIDDSSSEGIAKALIRFSQTTEKERMECGERAREYILKNKNAKAQISRLIRFATEL